MIAYVIFHRSSSHSSIPYPLLESDYSTLGDSITNLTVGTSRPPSIRIRKQESPWRGGSAAPETICLGSTDRGTTDRRFPDHRVPPGGVEHEVSYGPRRQPMGSHSFPFPFCCSLVAISKIPKEGELADSDSRVISRSIGDRP